jgi:peptidyl-prolyl cis-trans isomerase SurA
MKKFPLTLVALACMPALAAGQVVEEITARVNNQISTKSEFARSKDQLRDEVKQQDPNSADKVPCRPREGCFRDLIDQQLLLDKGKDLGISGDTGPDQAV